MKLRNGFVSNSSSSSFVIAYDKTGILTNPKDIVDYVSNHLRSSIFFKSDLCEGYDVFSLDMKQKNYLLKHQKRFIKYNQEPIMVTDWEAESKPGEPLPEIEVPAVEAYTKVYRLQRYPYEYSTPDVDMSDVDIEPLTDMELMKSLDSNAPEDLKKKREKANNWYRIREEREREAIRKQKDSFLTEVREVLLKENVSPENLVVEYIDIDNNTCDSDGFCDSEFAPRYFGLDEDTYYEKIGDPDIEVEE